MRGSRATQSALAMVALLGLMTSAAWGVAFELSQTKEQLGLKYEVAAQQHESGRVSIVLTINDAGQLKPLDAITLHVPSKDKSGYADLSVTLATEDHDGVLTARAHLSRDLAERAELHLLTHASPGGGKPSPRSMYYHSIAVKEYLK